VRAGHFLANGVGGKFNVFLAEEAGHFHEFRSVSNEAQ
jgi:hypothetical protein